MIVAWNIRKERVARALSQEALAADAGVDRTYVGGLERGAENPTVLVLDKIAATLGIHISVLFDEPPADTPQTPPLKGGRKPAR